MLTLTHGGKVATLLLDRPRGNRISDDLMVEIGDRLEELCRDESVIALVIRGSGADFCLGREPTAPSAVARSTPHRYRQILDRITRVNTALMSFPGLSLAVVQGRALGFGAALVARCDMAIATEGARFGFPEVTTGLPPTIVASYLSHALSRKVAVDLVVSGREIDADEAVRVGLVTRTFAVEQIEPEVTALVEGLVARPPLVVRTIKEIFRNSGHIPPEGLPAYATTLLANVTLSREAPS